MVKCPNCRQTTREDLDRCQYCNALLPKLQSGFSNLIRQLFSRKRQEKEDL